MYVGYIFLIVFGIICVLTGAYTLMIKIGGNISANYDHKKPITPVYPWDLFGGCNKEEYEKIKERYETSLKEWEENRPLSSKIFYATPEWLDTTIFVIWIISIVLLVIASLVVTIGVLSDAQAINQWKEVYVMVQQIVNNGSDLENIAISQTKIEYNEWLTNAIANLRTYGNWSSWSLYEEELLALQYIM